MHDGNVLATVLLLFVFVGGTGYALTIYNGLVALKNDIRRSWANIDVLLKQRHDELPKLVATCEGYMRHEREIFDALAAARAALAHATTVPDRAAAEGVLTQALGRFFAVAEAYPDLKANTAFLDLQHRISDLENQVADRREYYNDVVTTFNTRLEQVPDKFVGDWCHFAPAPLFRVAESDREDVTIAFRKSA